MAVPALKREHIQAPARPRLRVARQGERGKQRTCVPSASEQRARELFSMFATVGLVIAVFCLGRVWLTAQAAEASLQSAELREQIKSERYVGDMLEVQQGALAAPGRVRRIAGTSMKMADAVSVSYIDLRDSASVAAGVPDKVPSTPKKTAPPSDAPKADGFGAALRSVMDVAAGEAQVLLVGDVGLIASK